MFCELKHLFWYKGINETSILKANCKGEVTPCFSQSIIIIYKHFNLSLTSIFSVAETGICFHSALNPTLNQSNAIPLCVICTEHPKCYYKWRCVSKPAIQFPSTPVVFVAEPLLYKCTVIIQGQALEPLLFDVTENIVEISEGIIIVE